MSREYTNKLLEAMEDGLIGPQQIAEMALGWLSEQDVEDMCRANDLFTYEDAEECEN